MSQEKCLEIHDLLSQLADLLRQSIILLLIDIDLGLKVGKPLLLPLATLECGDTI